MLLVQQVLVQLTLVKKILVTLVLLQPYPFLTIVFHLTSREELVFCFAADGKLYRWQPSAPSTIASAISNAPIDNIATVVSNERHLFALGSGGDPRKIAWSEREDNTKLDIFGP